ncbi:MAG: LapA family protein [Spirochaetales bacterium]|nr:LapA family protein [Spirochaetales bacterium]
MGRFILGIIIGVLVIIFMFQNVAPIEVRFIAWTVTLSRAVILLIVFAVGIIVGWVFHGAGKRRRDKAKRRK